MLAVAVLFKTSGKNVQTADYGIIERWVNGFSGRT